MGRNLSLQLLRSQIRQQTNVRKTQHEFSLKSISVLKIKKRDEFKLHYLRFTIYKTIDPGQKVGCVRRK